MKRKFSLRLAPIRTSDKPEDQPAKQAVPPQQHQPAHARKRSSSVESIWKDSPFINRRTLDAQTERELRVACRTILKNFKPSDFGMENTDPKLDFAGLAKRKASRGDPRLVADVKVRIPTGAPSDSTGSSSIGRKLSISGKTRTRTKVDNEIKARTQQELPVRRNSERKPTNFGWLDDRDDKREQNLRRAGRGPSIDLPRSAALKADDSGVSTPVTTASTLAYAKTSVSTAPMSATLPPTGKNLLRSPSYPGNTVTSPAEGQAGESVRRELSTKKSHKATQSTARPSTAHRPSSRNGSIASGLKEHVFPAGLGRSLSRKHSQDSFRTTGTAASQNSSQDLGRSGSVSGWRKWGLGRSSSRSSSRAGTRRGAADEPEKKSEPSMVDLNRELPPLPSLDTWKDTVESPRSPSSPCTNAHIASLMRPQEAFQERVRKHSHRRTASGGLAVQHANAYPARSSSKAVSAPTHVNPDSPIILDPVITGSSSTSNLCSRREQSSSTHTRQRSGGSFTSPSSPTGRISSEMPRDSSDRTSTDEVRKKDEHKSTLKKVFGGWMHRKNKKEEWVQRDGVVQSQQASAQAPVGR